MLNLFINELDFWQRSEADSSARILVMLPLVLSAVMLTPMIAASITSVWTTTPASTVARSAPSSRSAMTMSAVSALIPRKLLDGELHNFYFILLYCTHFLPHALASLTITRKHDAIMIFNFNYLHKFACNLKQNTKSTRFYTNWCFVLLNQVQI